jgi:hypothetical protein
MNDKRPFHCSFYAIFKENDATSTFYTDETLDADISSVISDQTPECTEEIHPLLPKH